MYRLLGLAIQALARQFFYPAELSENQWLDSYTQHFDTVEITNTFYRLPDTPTLPPYLALQCPSMATAQRIAGWMRRQLAATCARGFIVGLSGGVDSAVVARLGQLAAPGAVVGAILPCHSDPDDERDAALVASHFQMPTVR